VSFLAACDIADSQIEAFVNNPSEAIQCEYLLKFPSFTQVTERCIRHAAEASVAVCGQEEGDGRILRPCIQLRTQ